MSGNWFYVSQWQRKRWDCVGLEMDYEMANNLFRSILGYDDNMYLALIKKDNKWKVVISEDDVDSWDIVKTNKDRV